MASTYEIITTYTVPTATATITLSSIPATYTDLILVSNAKKNTTGAGSGINVQFNGDTSTNYSATFVEGNGSSASSYRATNGVRSIIGTMTALGATNQFDVSIAQIMNYSNTTTYKSYISRYNATDGGYLGAVVGLWRSTAAISSITIMNDGSVQIAAGTKFDLYGIKAA